jgi:cytidyltransferase-like protein
MGKNRRLISSACRVTTMNKKLSTVLVGGTFDEFHRGHRKLIMTAFEAGERVMIGLSSDDLARELRKKHEIATPTCHNPEREALL